ncbi:MAG: carboxypeptidase regulatory-like domain-containing protein, partial [Candidatus Marinimicrobia bacterium]|nr:carboxypeptidase regulatory-like domain-containing protein [Candidatus Neomarinimicrobiota bacterium]
MKRLLLAILVFALPLLPASTGNIKGRVTDAKTGKALVGVNVIVQKTSLGSTTDNKGNYKISKVPAGIYTISATMIGYIPETIKTVKVKTGKATTVNISLKTKKLKGESVTITATKPPSAMELRTSKKSDGPVTVDGGSSLSKKTPGEDRDEPPSADIPSLVRPRPSTPPESKDTHTPKPEPRPRPHDKPEPGDADVHTETLDLLEFKVTSPAGGVPPERPRPAPPQSGGLKAGFADDNQQFNYFLNFLNQYQSAVNSYGYDISERIHLMLKDKEGKSLANVKIKIFDRKEQRLLDEGKTYADGSYFVYPAEIAEKDKTFNVSFTIDDIYQTV